jgi:hypothetical protein
MRRLKVARLRWKINRSATRLPAGAQPAPSQSRCKNAHAPDCQVTPRAFRNHVPHVWHQHVATEPMDQRFFPVLPTARTQIAGEPHHAVWPFGKRWCARGHFISLALRRGSGPRRFTLGAGGFFGGRTHASSRAIISSAGALLFRPSGLRKRGFDMPAG